DVYTGGRVGTVDAVLRSCLRGGPDRTVPVRRVEIHDGEPGRHGCANGCGGEHAEREHGSAGQCSRGGAVERACGHGERGEQRDRAVEGGGGCAGGDKRVREDWTTID